MALGDGEATNLVRHKHGGVPDQFTSTPIHDDGEPGVRSIQAHKPQPDVRQLRKLSRIEGIIVLVLQHKAYCSIKELLWILWRVRHVVTCQPNISSLQSENIPSSLTYLTLSIDRISTKQPHPPCRITGRNSS